MGWGWGYLRGVGGGPQASLKELMLAFKVKKVAGSME